MKRITLLKLALIITILAAVPATTRADCAGSSVTFRTEVVTYYETYYELPAEQNLNEEWACNYETNNGRRYCRVRLYGVMHSPLYFVREGQRPPQFPVIVYNHGSEEEFTAYTKACSIANYFVPKGYIVFVPFRRGHGDQLNSAKSTGVYIEDMLTDFDNRRPAHDTTCGDRQCYKAELLREQAEEDVAAAFTYLSGRADTKKDRSLNLVSAVSGSSYGGAITVLVNRLDLGQRAAVAFSPAAQNWGAVNFAYAAKRWVDAGNFTPLQDELLKASQDAKAPAFYLQAKWDYDTRATIDLAYAHAYGGNDPTHGQRFMAAIFPYDKPGPDPLDPDQLDYQSVHVGFANSTDIWGAAVLDFIRTYGVK